MRLFLSGATGVIGRRLLPRLIAEGHQVTAIGRTPEKRAALERLGVTATAAGLFDPAGLGEAVRGHQAVINLATRIPPSSRAFLPWAWRENDRIRSLGSRNLVDAALAGGAERFIQESFAPIYPDCGDEWIDEDTPVRPTRYNRTAVDAESATARFSSTGRTGIVLRFAYFYGSDSGYARDTLRMIRKGWAPGFGKPEGFISSVSQDDAAEAVLAALRGSPGVYNVTDDEPLRRRVFFDVIADLLGVPPPRLPPDWMTRLAGSIGETLGRSQRISNRKLRSCGWKPKFPSGREGWRAVVAELRDQGSKAVLLR
jgi:nucleoside-diphosphate-sugar epimerase